jgi:hypothetical protein
MRLGRCEFGRGSVFRRRDEDRGSSEDPWVEVGVGAGDEVLGVAEGGGEETTAAILIDDKIRCWISASSNRLL